MIKHVGKHNSRQVVVIFREVPGEDHMALVSYSDILPSAVHDDVMRVVQSPAGQEASNLGDALFRVVGTNGENILQYLHNQGWIKKVRTQDVILRPGPKSEGVRLDEVNNIIRQLEVGGEGAKRLAQLDENAGLVDPYGRTNRDIPGPVTTTNTASTGTRSSSVNPDQQPLPNSAVSSPTASVSDPVDNAALAKTMLEQAEKMIAQINMLGEELKNLTAKAVELDPSLKNLPDKSEVSEPVQAVKKPTKARDRAGERSRAAAKKAAVGVK